MPESGPAPLNWMYAVWAGYKTKQLMTLHLVKLCVGVDSISELADWQEIKCRRLIEEGKPPDLFHRTRMRPRREQELLEGGSIYWVIKRVIQVRQKITDLREVRGDDGIRRCDIILDPGLVQTRPQPRRPFQGWRYLAGEDAPADIGKWTGDLDGIPEDMRAELIELGLY